MSSVEVKFKVFKNLKKSLMCVFASDAAEKVLNFCKFVFRVMMMESSDRIFSIIHSFCRH
jgi:hypothetical protein